MHSLNCVRFRWNLSLRIAETWTMLLCSIKIRNRNINRPPILLHDNFRSHIAKALQQQGIDDTWFFFNFIFFSYVPYPSSALAIIALYNVPFLVTPSTSDLFPILRLPCFAIWSLKLAKYDTPWLPHPFFFLQYGLWVLYFPILPSSLCVPDISTVPIIHSYL